MEGFIASPPGRDDRMIAPFGRRVHNVWVAPEVATVQTDVDLAGAP
jgi:hypothetical protein